MLTIRLGQASSFGVTVTSPLAPPRALANLRQAFDGPLGDTLPVFRRPVGALGRIDGSSVQVTLVGSLRDGRRRYPRVLVGEMSAAESGSILTGQLVNRGPAAVLRSMVALVQIAAALAFTFVLLGALTRWGQPDSPGGLVLVLAVALAMLWLVPQLIDISELDEGQELVEWLAARLDADSRRLSVRDPAPLMRLARRHFLTHEPR